MTFLPSILLLVSSDSDLYSRSVGEAGGPPSGGSSPATVTAG